MYESKLQLVIFTGLIVLSILLFIWTIVSYQRKQKNKQRTNDCWDCAIYSPDCLPTPRGNKFDCDSPDCDCTPDCSPQGGNEVKEWITLSFMPCHRMQERSMILWGKQFPLCYRCMGILLGIIIGIPFASVLVQFLSVVHLLLGGILISTLLIDGFTQKWGWRQSTNPLRLLTGLLCGLGLSLVIVLSSKWGVIIIMLLTSSNH